MKKLWKKVTSTIMGAFLAMGTLSLLPMTVNAAVDVDSLADGTAYLSINNTDWADYEAEYVNAEITGDGQYTVSMTASEPQNLVQFNALEVKNGEAKLGSASVLTIDEIKINGKAIELQGKSYTCSADGAGVTTRVNLYNEWNAPVDADGNVGEDFRSNSDPSECTATLWSSDLNTGVSSVEVTFTVSDYGKVKEAAGGDSEYVPSENAGKASLQINDADWSGKFVSQEIMVEKDGTYTVSAEAEEPQNLAQFNALQIVEGEKVLGNGTVVVIDEIKINGETVELLGDNYTCSADGAGIDTRVNLYNEWNSPVDENGVPGSDVRAAGDATATTAILWSADYLTSGVKSVEVTFTVSGVGTFVSAEEEAAETAASVDLGGTYNAYIGIQGPKYSFRDSYDNAATGFGTDFFNQITFQGDTTDKTSIPGTLTDAVIAGNGTYTVSASDIQWPDDEFADQDHMNLIFFSTDIPNSGEITISDVVLKINGSEVADINPEIVEDGDYVVCSIQNIWVAEHETIGYYAVPFSNIEISFKVSGFNYDSAAKESVEPALDAAQDDNAQGSGAETVTAGKGGCAGSKPETAADLAGVLAAFAAMSVAVVILTFIKKLK